MKIRNIDMVNFMNHVHEIRVKKLPTMFSFALKCNITELSKLVPSYKEAYEKAEDDAARNELAMQEVNVNIQTISKKVLEKLDTDSRFDALTALEFEIISFMIE